MRTLVTLPHSTVVGEVDVYRDGEAVIVIGKGSFEKETPYGEIQTVVQGISRFENKKVFEFVRNKAKKILAKRLEGAPWYYTQLCHKFDLDRDVDEAPQLPAGMLAKMPALLTGGER